MGLNVAILQNKLVLAPASIKILTVQNNVESNERKLDIAWNKTEGGDAIDKFFVICESASLIATETVPYIPGQHFYEHTTVKLVQG